MSDSHGRGLEAIVHRDYKDWRVLTVWVGAQLEYVRSKYYDQVQEVYVFGEGMYRNHHRLEENIDPGVVVYK